MKAPLEPQPLSQVLTIYQLRQKMLAHVHAGHVEWSDFDALFEVLEQSLNLMPWYRPEIYRSVSLIAKLLQNLPALPTA
jgi:hypothetical protein